MQSTGQVFELIDGPFEEPEMKVSSEEAILRLQHVESDDVRSGESREDCRQMAWKDG